MNKLGTVWVAPGKGASVFTLRKEIASIFGVFDWGSVGTALAHLDKKESGANTNLFLSGEPLAEYDLKRIAVCE